MLYKIELKVTNITFLLSDLEYHNCQFANLSERLAVSGLWIFILLTGGLIWQMVEMLRSLYWRIRHQFNTRM